MPNKRPSAPWFSFLSDLDAQLGDDVDFHCIWPHLTPVALDECLAVQEPGPREVYHILQVAIATTFQLCQRQVVGFERPKLQPAPERENGNQPRLVAVRIGGNPYAGRSHLAGPR